MNGGFEVFSNFKKVRTFFEVHVIELENAVFIDSLLHFGYIEK